MVRLENYDAIEVYKNVLSGRVKIFPKNFWQGIEGKNNAIECTRYLIEKILAYSDDDIRKNLSQKIFKDYKLRGMLLICFNKSPYLAINTVYPNRFKPWEFKQSPRGVWTKSTAIEATKWLIEEKLKFSDEEIKKNLSAKLFKQNNLGGMLAVVYKDKPFMAINDAYPGRFKEWDFNCGNDFWTDEKAIEAVKWLIEEKLNLTDNELKLRLSKKMFNQNNLGGLLGCKFSYRPYNAINFAYPNKFKENDFKNHTKSKLYIKNS